MTVDCCDGLICSNNVCTTPPQCRASAAACAVTSDCCSPLVCLNNSCQKAPRCGDGVCADSEADTCCTDCGCGLGFSCVNGGACTNVGASSLVFNLENDCPSSVIDLRFFDLVDGLSWPADTTMAFQLPAGQTQAFNLSCTQGSLICFGGKADGGLDSWGIGPDGSASCQSCCFNCNGGHTVLTPLTCP